MSSIFSSNSNNIIRVINIRDYGALGDGSTDDTTVIQAAMDAASAAQCILYAPPGTYIVTNIQFKPNVTMMGAGWSTVFKLKNSSNTFPLQATFANAVTNLTLRDFKVDLNGANQSSNGWVAITGATNVTMDHVYIYNSRTFGLLAQPNGDPITGNQCTGWLIKNCRFDTQVSPTTDFAVLNIQYSRIVDNYWAACAPSASPSYALSAGRSMQHTIIENNNFQNTNMVSIGLEDVKDVQVIGNNIIGSGSHGIFIPTFQATFSVERVIVSGNVITGSTDSGIAVGGGSGTGRIINSQIVNNICYLNSKDGIRVQGNDNCFLSNNTCFNNNQGANTAPTGSGIRFSGGTPTYSTIIGNKCYDTQGTPTQSYGIYAGNGDNTICDENTVYGNVTAQISVSGASSIVRNNQGFNPVTNYDLGTVSGGAATFDRVNGDTQTITLGASTTFTFTSGNVKGDTLILRIAQDATGLRLATWPSNFKKAGGSLVLSTAGNAIDTIRAVWDGTNWIETGRSLSLS
jgi:parallel beta-helix repeat protein